MTNDPNTEATLTLEVFQKMKQKFRERYKDVAIAYVVRPQVEVYCRAVMEQSTSNPLCAIPIYTDPHQQEDILAFSDQLTLRCYLIRREFPATWLLLLLGDREGARAMLTLHLAKEIPDDTNL